MTASEKGTVFNIQYFSVHDGPGIRTVIFLKGCPLRCLWCSNPESQKRELEIAWQKSKCIGCMQCKKVCPNAALYSENRIKVEENRCNKCMLCTECCPTGALYRIGEWKGVEELLDEIEGDEVFYSNSKGGLTLSGGEPLMQGEFAICLLKGAKERYLNTAIETTGHVKWEILEEAAKYLDSIFYDIKSLNEEKHLFYTKVSNQLIVDNFHKLCSTYQDLPITVRTPVIPGVNDTKEDILQILDLIKSYPNVKYELLPYHAFGKSKYKNLDREYLMPEVGLKEEIFEELKSLVKNEGKEA